MASKNTSSGSRQQTTRSNRDSARWTLGLLLFFTGLFATASVLFSFFCWSADLSVLQGVGSDSPLYDDTVENLCGRAGAWLGEQLVGRSFGVFGVLIPVMLTLVGVRIIRQRPILFNHSILSLSLIMILGSLTLGFAFGDKWSLCSSTGWGGAFGIGGGEWLGAQIGSVGTLILLLGGWILTGVFINRNFINTVNTAGNAMVDKGGKIVDLVKQSVVNVADHRSKSGEEKTDAEPEPDSKPESEQPQPEPVPAPVDASARTSAADGVAEVTIQRPAPVAAPVSDEPDESPFLEIPLTEEAPATVVEPAPSRPAGPRIVGGDDVFTEVDLSGCEADAAFTAPRESEQPQYASEPAPVVDGITEYTLTAEPEIPAEGVVVTVEAREAKVVDEKSIESSLYDPLKDLNNYQRPPVTLLEDYTSDSQVSDEEIYENKSKIEQTLKDFGIPIQRIKATVGPTVTLYEIVQAQGVKISKIQGLENDIAQSLKALGIRIIAPIPGKGTIGIEVPNRDKQVVSMYSAVRSLRFQESKAELPVVIGRTIQNENYVFDLAKMPHLLVAGATGQGKSVGLNAIITSLLYKKHPSQLKFVMIDPKMVEFSLYSKIEKHFLAKMESEDEAIVTDPRKAVYTLNSLCTEMDNRLELCKMAGARNIAEYNDKFTARRLNPEKGHRYLPYIVVVVDEFADLIMTAREVEGPVMRLAQKARAIGIHLIIATQRPDVKVITGGIKANFPARIAFRVMQMIDSRTIIDQPGANQLIGRGDMLFSKDGELIRIQCALVETREVERIVDFIGRQQGYSEAYRLPDYVPESSGGESSSLGSESGAPVRYDTLFADIARAAVSQGQISTSSIQRNYEVGFNRAGRIMMQLERAGIVGRQEGAKPRDILFHDLPSLEARLQELGVF